MSGGFGTGLAGGLLTAVGGGNTESTVGVGLIAGAAGFLAESMVQDVNYTVVADIQISEKTKGSVKTSTLLKNDMGSSGKTVSTSSEEGNMKKYRTRLASVANKMNLKVEEATPRMVSEVAHAIAGVF